MKKSKGFTLIELLVVIAIIAILAIAIMIAYNRAKKASANAKRQEICRSIYTAQELCYQQDNTYYSLSGLVNNGCLGTNPDDGRIGPNSENTNVTWASSVAGDSDGFYAKARIDAGDDQRWFCCNGNGCKELDSDTCTESSQ